MRNVPATSDLVALLRNADEQAIRRRLDELEGEAAALRTLLRSIQARNRARHPASKTEGRHHE